MDTNKDLSEHYSIHIHYSKKESEYVVRSPEFPSLCAFGVTREEALSTGLLVMNEMIDILEEERHQLPMPQTLEFTDTTSSVELPNHIKRILQLEADASGLSIDAIALQYISIGIIHSRTDNNKDDHT